jgi:hypothetical protein
MNDPKRVYCSSKKLILLLVGDLDDFEWSDSRAARSYRHIENSTARNQRAMNWQLYESIIEATGYILHSQVDDRRLTCMSEKLKTADELKTLFFIHTRSKRIKTITPRCMLEHVYSYYGHYRLTEQ